MHAGYLPGYPASHGCVRMPRDLAAMFFDEVHIGTRVTVVGGTHSLAGFRKAIGINLRGSSALSQRKAAFFSEKCANRAETPPASSQSTTIQIKAVGCLLAPLKDQLCISRG